MNYGDFGEDFNIQEKVISSKVKKRTEYLPVFFFLNLYNNIEKLKSLLCIHCMSFMMVDDNGKLII